MIGKLFSREGRKRATYVAWLADGNQPEVVAE